MINSFIKTTLYLFILSFSYLSAQESATKREMKRLNAKIDSAKRKMSISFSDKVALIFLIIIKIQK